MIGNDDEIQTHLLILILKTQLEILARLNGTPMLVATPPMRIARPPEQEKENGQKTEA